MRKAKKIDYFFLTIAMVILAAGLVILASASSDIAKIKFNNSYFYLEHQFFHGFLPGLILFFFFLNFPYFRLRKLSLSIFIFSFFLLLLSFTPLGHSLNGARRWLKIGNFFFQPAEIMKFAYLLYLSAWLTQSSKIRKFKESLPFFFTLTSIVVITLFFQRSTSAAFILSLSGLIVYFCSGIKWSQLIGLVTILSLFFGLAIFISPYRLNRIVSFFHRQDIYGKNYHLRQSLYALERGGLLGVGYGRSATKIKYLPEAISDSIFSVIAEEFGFLGSVSVIILYLLFFWRGIIIALKNSDKFAKLLVIGFVSLILLQVIIHISSNSGFLPYTGVPLPFISYGGTAMIVFLSMAGVILNISRYKS